MERVKAIGIVSGGLDSAIAVALVKRQDVEILGLHFHNGFSPNAMKAEVLGPEALAAFLEKKRLALTESLGVPVEVVDISEEYLDLLLSPQHGYGSQVNPCIDCRVDMLLRAAGRMRDEGAGFVFTGEVLGQRPMSQHRQAMITVERKSGLEGRLLRPLSARLLPETIPEREGLIDRSLLLDIQGRSRKRQMAFAEEFGIAGYSQPAGGCTLTDENYGRKFREMMEQEGDPGLSRRMAVLLAIGRHFRLDGGARLVVGRNKTENEYIERNFSGDWLASPVDCPGPTTLLLGEPVEGDLERAAAFTARYSDCKREASVGIRIARGDEEFLLDVPPAEDGELENHRI
jgi:tRNA-specific 2-thiouridylase